jgi:hypothetical protein
MANVSYQPETEREDDIVASCPNEVPWDYVAD